MEAKETRYGRRFILYLLCDSTPNVRRPTRRTTGCLFHVGFNTCIERQLSQQEYESCHKMA